MFWLGQSDFHKFVHVNGAFPLSFLMAGCSSEVPLRPGGSHGETGRTGEENWQSRGGLEALLGGAQGGEAGKIALQPLSPASPATPTAFGRTCGFGVSP